MKITIDLEPGDLISVHYDDKMPPHVALNTLMTTTVNVFACLLLILQRIYGTFSY